MAAHAQTTPDPGIMGPYAVTKVEYNLGDQVAPLDSLASLAEVRGSVHYPTTLTGGPFPVIILLHGRHSTCYRNATPHTSTLAWPCPTGYSPIQSFQGYDYHARFMASHGYIVISISCNAINAVDGGMSNSGMPARGQLVQYHLNLWNTYNSGATSPLTAQIGASLVGMLDLQRIGTMGHSRGGEGVVYNALLNRSLGSPYGIKAVLTLAPVDFFRKKLNGIPLLNIAPYCDGDVSNIQGVHFFDDVRYSDSTDEAPKHSILLMGANHNFFNTVWTPGSYIAGTADDWDGSYGSTAAYCSSASATSGRLDTTTQKAAYNSYASAFFRTYVGGETQFEPILETQDIMPPASALVDTAHVFVSYHPGRTDRKDVNTMDTTYDVIFNTMLDTVSQNGLVAMSICGGGLTVPACAVATAAAKEPHKGTTSIRGLNQLGIKWNDTTDWYNNAIPAAQQDFTYVTHLQFRAALRFNECIANQNLDFSVQLIDGAGNTATRRVHDHSYALFYQPGNNSLLPKVMFNTISIPIDSFSGIDRTSVRYIRFLFNKSDTGSILVSDIALVNSKCGKVNGTFGYTYDTVGYDAAFFDTVAYNEGDTASVLWNFGDPASGTANTSTAHNPVHTFSGAGTYTVCMYLSAKRQNQRICTDTVCTTVTIVFALHTPDITTVDKYVSVVPNPAASYVQISGADPAYTLTILNTLGQSVLTAPVGDGHITLPSGLANGMYYISITTPYGLVHRSLQILR